MSKHNRFAQFALVLALAFTSGIADANPSQTFPAGTTVQLDGCRVIVAGQATANPEWIQVLARYSNIALFEPGTAVKMVELENKLRSMGVDALMLKEPTADDIAYVKNEPGYSYGPLVVTWHQPARSFEEQLDSRQVIKDKAKKKNDWRRKLKASEGKVYEEILPVTQESWTLYWDTLYKPHVADKPKGQAPVGPDVKSLLALANKDAVLDLSKFTLVLYREVGTNLPLAGVLLERFPDAGILKTRCAAFNKTGDYAKFNLYSRTHEATAKIAKAEGLPTMSYGSDPNFYGNEMLDLGLLSYKAKLGYEPELWTTGPNFFGQRRIIKVLNPEKMGLPHHLTFAFENPAVDNKLHLRVTGQMDTKNFSFPQGIRVVDEAGHLLVGSGE